MLCWKIYLPPAGGSGVMPVTIASQRSRCGYVEACAGVPEGLFARLRDPALCIAGFQWLLRVGRRERCGCQPVFTTGLPGPPGQYRVVRYRRAARTRKRARAGWRDRMVCVLGGDRG